VKSKFRERELKEVKEKKKEEGEIHEREES
jgi:hypothetical protein